MEEKSIPYTAFTVGPLGFYKCVRMPFGLTNTPATFQHLMESCLGDYHLKYCIIYLDDIIIFSKTPKEHISRLHKVFQKLDEAGLHLKPNKCEFFRDRLEYLGQSQKDSSHSKLASTQKYNSDQELPWIL